MCPQGGPPRKAASCRPEYQREGRIDSQDAQDSLNIQVAAKHLQRRLIKCFQINSDFQGPLGSKKKLDTVHIKLRS
jgi:hypothetical protein